MYTRRNSIDEILNYFPDFKESWLMHLEEWEGEEAREFGIDIIAFWAYQATVQDHLWLISRSGHFF